MATLNNEQEERVQRAIAEVAGLPGNAIIGSITADSNGRVNADFYADPQELRTAIEKAINGG